MGRWIDFRRDYKTMYPWFMESVWFVFKQLYEKGFVYRGFKVRIRKRVLQMKSFVMCSGNALFNGLLYAIIKF